MANCQENPTFRDKYGNDCNFYKKYPELCAESLYSANDQGQTAQMVCCACSSEQRVLNVPRAWSDEVSSEPFKPENPCPMNQVWANSREAHVDGRRIEVGTAEEPAELSLQIHEVDLRFALTKVTGEATRSVDSLYWKSGDFNLVMDVYGSAEEVTKKGCWRPVSPDNTAVFTCNSDDYCKNLDLDASKPGNLVYKCPQATCNLGNCYCGPDCMKDNVTKICKPRNEINKPMQSVVPTPPLNICVPSEVPGESKDTAVCWKRTRNFDSSGNPHDSLVNCDPSFCGFTTTVKQIKLAGSQFSLYTAKPAKPAKVENFSDTAAPTSVPSTSAPSTSAPSTAAPSAQNIEPSTIIIIIILSIIGVILLGIIIQYIMTLVSPKTLRGNNRFG